MESTQGADAERTITDGNGVIGPSGVLFHPGAPKAATTAVQSCLAAIRDDLWRDGLVYPGREMNHIAASRAALDVPNVPHEATRDARKWANLQKTVERHSGRAIVSSELFAVADLDRARRLVTALGGERVHVVLTLRSLHAVIPSAWQESVKAGGRSPFGAFVEEVLARPNIAGKDTPGRFWTVHDQAAFVARWVEATSPDRVTVLALDPSQPQMVFSAFEDLIGLRRGVLDPSVATRANRSMTWAEAEAVRAYHTLVDLPGEFENVGEMLPPQVVSILVEGRTPPPDEPRAHLSGEQAARTHELSLAAIDGIRATGARVIGDLGSLAPPPDPDGPAASPPSGAPFDVVAHLLAAQREFARRNRAANDERKAAQRQERRQERRRQKSAGG